MEINEICFRSFKGMFSSMKYTQAAMPMTGGPKIIEQLMNENLKSVVDSEVTIFKGLTSKSLTIMIRLRCLTKMRC